MKRITIRGNECITDAAHDILQVQVIPSGQFSQFFVLDATDQLSRGMLLKKGRVTMGSTDSATSRKKELNLERPDCVFTS